MALQFGRSRLPELLDRKRMSQAEFARKMEISDAFVSKIISGHSKLSLLSSKKASDILGCTINELYEWVYT